MKPARIASLEEARTDPGRLASSLFSRTRSPYPAGDVRENLTPDEQIAHIKAVTIDQIRELYRDYLGAVAGELSIIGDFEPQPAIAKINEILDDWKPNKPFARIERIAFTDVPGGRQQILTPDKANANYLGGHSIAMNDRHADYPALLLGNFLFGGGTLSSRLGDRVRQKEGLSYGVSSSFAAGVEDNSGGMTMTAICNPANIGKVETAIREEFDRLLKDGIPKDEFDKAQEALLLSRQRQRNEDFYIASRLERGLRIGQTLDYDAGLDKKLESLTPDEVHAALKKHLDPKRLVIVVAGDFEKGKAD